MTKYYCHVHKRYIYIYDELLKYEVVVPDY